MKPHQWTRYMLGNLDVRHTSILNPFFGGHLLESVSESVGNNTSVRTACVAFAVHCFSLYTNITCDSSCTCARIAFVPYLPNKFFLLQVIRIFKQSMVGHAIVRISLSIQTDHFLSISSGFSVHQARKILF